MILVFFHDQRRFKTPFETGSSADPDSDLPPSEDIQEREKEKEKEKKLSLLQTKPTPKKETPQERLMRRMRQQLNKTRTKFKMKY
jgi:hypothetical protein